MKLVALVMSFWVGPHVVTCKLEAALTPPMGYFSLAFLHRLLPVLFRALFSTPLFLRCLTIDLGCVFGRWRSWNCLLNSINQSVITRQVNALAEGPLLSAGYARIGIDGGWVCQNPVPPGPPSVGKCQCGGVMGSYHNSNGDPLPSMLRFPNLTAIAELAHSKGVKLDFYGNSCNCVAQELKVWRAQGGNPEQDVAMLAKYDLDGIKVDGCSAAHNISRWVHALADLDGPPRLLENCGNNGPLHWSPPTVGAVSGSGPCGFQMFRVSADIAPQFYSAMFNLQAAAKFSNISRPGCWACVFLCFCSCIMTLLNCPPAADPDMLQVGSEHLTTEEAHSHFAAWCISSAPLILGFDLTDTKAQERAASIVSNAGAISVSQSWAGHAGRVIRSAEEQFNASTQHGAASKPGQGRPSPLPAWQIWAKPLEQTNGVTTRVAVLTLNISPQTRNISLHIADLTGSGMLPSQASRVKIRNVWSGKALGELEQERTVQLRPHESDFLVLQVD